jgi:hypothetical protein
MPLGAWTLHVQQSSTGSVNLINYILFVFMCGILGPGYYIQSADILHFTVN